MTSFCWFKHWRKFVKDAHRYTDPMDKRIFIRMALLAQMEYITAQALELKRKSNDLANEAND